jgi:hypothetical protein
MRICGISFPDLMRAVRPTLVGVALLGVNACGGLAGVGPGQGIGAFNEDRVTIGEYGDVLAVAASPRMVFVASRSGLAVRDVFADRWLRPLMEEDGYPATRITGVVGDPELDGVWITALGEVLFYRPAIDQLIRTVVAGRIDRIFFDRTSPGDGAYVGSADQWTLVSPAGFAHPVTYDQLPPAGQRVISPTLETLSMEIPSLQSFAGLLTRDDALRSWRPATAARAPGRSDVWLGTSGGGVFLVDPLFNRARAIRYGLFEPGASALALAADGVWIGTLGLEPRGTGGVVATSTDLQSWSWLRGPADGSMAGLRVYDIAVRDGQIYAATDRGVAVRTVADPPNGRVAEWDWMLGRRADRAFALAVASGVLWIGGNQGLSAVPARGASGPGAVPVDSSRDLVSLGGSAIRALAVSGDTLWVGSETGLRHVRMSERSPRFFDVPNSGAGWLARPIVALASADSVLAIASDERAGILDLRRGVAGLLPGNPSLAGLGRLRSIAIDGRTVWVGGDRGAVVIDRATGLARNAGLAGAIPDAVLDIVLQPEFAWLATPRGVIRVRRLSDGGPR